MKRITRDRHLTPEEAAEDQKVREAVEKEFPPLGLIEHMKASGQRLIEVTTTRLYAIPEGDLGMSLEDLMREWFVKYRGGSHAFRDGSEVGGSVVFRSARVLTEDGKEIKV